MSRKPKGGHTTGGIEHATVTTKGDTGQQEET